MAKKDNDREVTTRVDSAAWGLIALIPFGWIILWSNINGRRREVERGLRDKESAIASINNYVIGAIVTTIVACLFLCIASSGAIIVPNFIAMIILGVSAAHNNSRIKKIETDIDGDEAIGMKEVLSGDVVKKKQYTIEVIELKKRLELISYEDNYESAITEIQKDIMKAFNKYKNANYLGEDKYKIYELRAEYYYITGKKQLAKRYIEEAIAIREQSKIHEEDNDEYMEEDYGYEVL